MGEIPKPSAEMQRAINDFSLDICPRCLGYIRSITDDLECFLVLSMLEGRKHLDNPAADDDELEAMLKAVRGWNIESTAMSLVFRGLAHIDVKDGNLAFRRSSTIK